MPSARQIPSGWDAISHMGHYGPQRIELRFRPNESLMLKIDAEGRVSFVEL